MATGVRSWSQTAASNSTADASVNWAEGMLPSAVNDSARAEMASVAKWRDDLSGVTSTAGTSTAYTLASNQGLALTAGVVAGFNPHVTNNATCTINIDSLGAKPLRPSPNVEFQPGVLAAGTPYEATYFTSNSGEWIVKGRTIGNLQFPATQVASTDANTLDDYEEGTWTPALTFGGGATGLTYTTQAGAYVKVGKLVHVQAKIVVNSNGSSTGAAVLTSLPFTSHATIPAQLQVSLDNGSGIASESAFWFGSVDVNATTVQLDLDFNGDRSTMIETNVVDGTTIIVSGTYIASA